MQAAHRWTSWLRANTADAVDTPSTQAAYNAFAHDVCDVGLAALFLERASALGIELPRHIRDRLRDHGSRVAAFNLNALDALEHVLLAFNRAGVPVMLLKGSALLHTIYTEPGLRPMSDLDLLIRPEDARAAMTALEQAGCRRGFELLREDFFPKYYCEVEFITGTRRPVRIDLHARPFHPMRLSRVMPDDALFEDARTVRVGEATALVPCPESMLIHLAGHAAFHGCSRLIWIYDLKRLIEWAGDDFDWDRFVERCDDWRLSLPVRTALAEASRHLGPMCPEDTLRRLAAQRTTWQDRLMTWAAPRVGTSPMLHVTTNLLTCPGIGFRAGYLASILAPSRGHLEGVYPYRHWGWTICANACRFLRRIPGLKKCSPATNP